VTPGFNAESSRLEEAGAAVRAGTISGGLDLFAFVCEAVQAEARSDDAITRHPKWHHALAGPERVGWWAWKMSRAGTRSWGCCRLTQDRDVLADPEGRPLGFLGRAHPIVGRALDRVRHLVARGKLR